MTHTECLGILLRNLILNKAPCYDLRGWAEPFSPHVLGVTPDQIEHLNDDRIGRALDHLFDADRASMQTELVVRAIQEFSLNLDQLHNDSTSITFSGDYEDADGENKRGKDALKITQGHNKDHRPDLKQLLWILTVTADGAVPVHYRTCDGNTSDSPTHRESWDAIRALVGRTDFIYVADCKLCTKGNMNYIASQEGKFITLLPGNRKEYVWFREYIQSHELPWEEIVNRPDPRVQNDTPEVYRMVESPMSSAEGFRIIWVWSSKKSEQDMAGRQSRMENAVIRLERIETRLRNPRNHLDTRADVVVACEKAIYNYGQRWIGYDIREEEKVTYKQEGPGRPGPNTHYRKDVQVQYHVGWHTKIKNIEFDTKCDGMFPFITNCKGLSFEEILDKYKYQPYLENRHEEIKNIMNVAPVYLKNVTRIESILFLTFAALLIRALIERQVRLKMKEHGIESLPIYPESRKCTAPTTRRILELFNNLQLHTLWDDKGKVQSFLPELTGKQQTLLRLLDIPEEAYLKIPL
jgi:transposase